MFDLRPVGYVIGLLVAILGATMILPLIADLFRFSRPDFPHLALAVGIGLLAGGWSGAFRAARRRLRRHGA